MHGLYLLWWVEHRQVPAPVVAAVLAAGDLAVLAFELPTGWFADRVGHRVSLIVGSTIQAVGMLWCWLGEGVSGLLIASLLIALGDAFRSGADQALLYRSCLALDREEDFQAIESRSNAFELIGLLVLLVTGGAIVANWGFAAAWIAETLLSVTGIVIAGAMTEPPAVETAHRSESTRPGARLLPPSMWAVILPAAFLVGSSSAASFVAQTTNASGPTTVTLLVAAITAAEAAGSLSAARVRLSGPRSHMLLGAAGAAVVALALLLPHTIPWSATALAFFAGLAEPLRDSAIQQMARDDARARAASVASACSMAVSMTMLPLAGMWQPRSR